MANLTGLTQRETVLELPRSATRPMGTRRGAKGRTVIDYKDDTIEITRPVPETVFRTTDFDLTKEVASIKRGVDRRHAKDLVQATHEMNRRSVVATPGAAGLTIVSRGRSAPKNENKHQRYKTLGKGRRQPVPVGIMVDENQNDVILYDEYPQWYRMSEYNENFFAYKDRAQLTTPGKIWSKYGLS
eukprot:g14043.t1